MIEKELSLIEILGESIVSLEPRSNAGPSPIHIPVCMYVCMYMNVCICLFKRKGARELLSMGLLPKYPQWPVLGM